MNDEVIFIIILLFFYFYGAKRKYNDLRDCTIFDFGLFSFVCGIGYFFCDIKNIFKNKK